MPSDASDPHVGGLAVGETADELHIEASGTGFSGTWCATSRVRWWRSV